MSVKHTTQILAVLAVMLVVALGVVVFQRSPQTPPAPVLGSVQAAAVELCDPARPMKGQEDLRDWLTCRDLRAQRSMAVSTDLIAMLTLISLALGGLTVIGLAITIIQTRDALRKTDVEMADNRAFTRAQMRAYIGPEDQAVITYEIGDGSIIEYRFKNFGQTPARSVRAWAANKHQTGFTAAWAPDSDDEIILKERPDIQPGESISYRSVIDVDVKTDTSYQKRTKSWSFAAVLAYEDIFGDTHVLLFCQIRSGSKLAQHKRVLDFQKFQHPNIPKPSDFQLP